MGSVHTPPRHCRRCGRCSAGAARSGRSTLCENRVPDHARHQVRVEHQLRGNTITIVERRAPWRPEFGPEWTSVPIAQLRYTQQAWAVYWADRNDRWHRVEDLPATKNIEPLLEAIDANHRALFWG